MARASYENIENIIDADGAEAMTFGFQGVPVVLINGYPFYGVSSEKEYSVIIENLLTEYKWVARSQ